MLTGVPRKLPSPRCGVQPALSLPKQSGSTSALPRASCNHGEKEHEQTHLARFKPFGEKNTNTHLKKKHLETHPNSAASSRSTVWLVRRICLVPRHGIGQDLRHWSHQASEWHERRPTGWGWESCPAGRERRTWLGVLINLAFLGTPNHTASTTFFRDLESLLKEKNGPSLSKCLARLWLHFSTSFRVGTAKTIHRNKKH